VPSLLKKIRTESCRYCAATKEVRAVYGAVVPRRLRPDGPAQEQKHKNRHERPPPEQLQQRLHIKNLHRSLRIKI